MSPINLTAEAYTIPFQWHELHARVFILLLLPSDGSFIFTAAVWYSGNRTTCLCVM